MDVREGGVTVTVPGEATEGIGDDVFYNPRQELNRDVTVAVLRAFRERQPRASSYLDAMAASGVRGVRTAAAGWDVTCCDRDPDAVALCRENLARNDLEGRVVHRDANAFLHESRFDVVDVDPFGTPIPFVDAAFANTRHLVCVTATDTAPLCGAHLQSGIRKYGAVPRNTDYHAEMGLRVLLSALARTAARYDVGVTPLVSHATSHYVRTYLELAHSATDADEALTHLGFVYHCEDCLHREHEHGHFADPRDACSSCGGNRVLTAGPLWLGPVRERSFTRTVRESIDEEMGTATQARRLLDRLLEELDLPTHFDQHKLYKSWGEPAIAMDDFLEAIRDAGFEASRAHYGGTTVKTTATVREIEQAVR